MTILSLTRSIDCGVTICLNCEYKYPQKRRWFHRRFYYCTLFQHPLDKRIESKRLRECIEAEAEFTKQIEEALNKL